MRSSASIGGVIAWFKLAGSALGLFGSRELAEDANLPDGPGGVTLAVNVETEEEEQAAIDAAVAPGGTQLKPATRAEWAACRGTSPIPTAIHGRWRGIQVSRSARMGPWICRDRHDPLSPGREDAARPDRAELARMSGAVARPSIPFDRIADTYDETRGGEERAERYAGALARHLDPTALTLDVGVGTGIVGEALARRGHRIVGVDIALAMLVMARARLGARVAQGDARRLPIADASLHWAISVWVLHVVGDVPGVLAEVARVLAPGGRYVVLPGGGQTPEDDVGRRLRALEQELDPSRRRDDSAERLAALAPGAGFRVAQTEDHLWTWEQPPAHVAASLEARSMSFLWDIHEAVWRDRVVPVIEWLRSLPDPERPIVRRARDTLVVLERE
jgi:SAM-dependent methyltransferase